ncbi:MAG: Glu-tRNA(Gln) amidotransferase subunit GatD [Candidatus Bathyarchaeota archaeon]|jgi:glutamyl-tRNA(Gln) amidotransferase subunit D|nr:Glu-tRNA(Gln) amidotransferase subunit GatD [Candidatus Bathyarchaeota archaeon A05DMB-5]MDH7558332.1 Glu-tRNA(Gln) amidotransferase subunit GatD [Candidatus Bathyarchaeota archaeon]
MGGEQKFSGYRGKALEVIKRAEVQIGDLVRITKNGEVYEGILIPRSEYGDEKHVVIKLKSGYNIGVRITPDTKIERIGKGAKPTFTPPEPPEQNPQLPKVVIISTGGTIASRVDYRTGAVRPALTASDLYSVVPELANIARIDAHILFSLFSENITPAHWTETAEATAKQISAGVEGVVIAHGTDTMGYTAAALSFALQNLPVPVILVGSQRSADRPSSDAATNLIGAVTAAAKAPFAEVAIAMHETTSDTTIILHKGTKVRKCHTSRRDTFKTINATPLARVQDQKITMLTENYQKRDPTKKLILKPKFNEKVALIKFYPGMNPALINYYVDNEYKGIILEGTGLGHVGKYCFNAIKDAVKHDVMVAMTSQCIWGRVNMNVYDSGRDLLALGVIPLEDMLPETALVKLMWIFGQTQNLEEAKKLLKTNIAGEFSPRTIPEKIGEE